MSRKHIRTRKGCLTLVLAATTIVALLLAFLRFQGQRKPEGRPQYVALGSSFAAGAGLGKLEPGSPWLCARSVNGYPQQLARMFKLSIVDMSCGGAVTRNILHGGQFFQGSQIDAITTETRLVTITVGGNDIGYVGDLSMLAARNSDSLFGRLVRTFWQGPKTPTERNYPQFKRELSAIVRTIQHRAPNAVIVLVTYPTIVPRTGSCETIGLNEIEAAKMRTVGDQLAAVTVAVAKQTGVLLVDMHLLGTNHNACSSKPWVTGWTNGSIAPFHPTLAGARATTKSITAKLSYAHVGILQERSMID